MSWNSKGNNRGPYRHSNNLIGATALVEAPTLWYYFSLTNSDRHWQVHQHSLLESHIYRDPVNYVYDDAYTHYHVYSGSCSRLSSVKPEICQKHALFLKEASNNSIREASGSAAGNLHFSCNVRAHSMPTVKGMAVAKHRVAIITRPQDN